MLMLFHHSMRCISLVYLFNMVKIIPTAFSAKANTLHREIKHGVLSKTNKPHYTWSITNFCKSVIEKCARVHNKVKTQWFAIQVPCASEWMSERVSIYTSIIFWNVSKYIYIYIVWCISIFKPLHELTVM